MSSSRLVFKRCSECGVDGAYPENVTACHECGTLLIMLEFVSVDELKRLRRGFDLEQFSGFTLARAIEGRMRQIFEDARMYQFSGLEDYILAATLRAIKEVLDE